MFLLVLLPSLAIYARIKQCIYYTPVRDGFCVTTMVYLLVRDCLIADNSEYLESDVVVRHILRGDASGR